eukprot:TRINITY_DN774244_c0_g1_i1.p1 TRINITY_DN774244_c0_g1~~TRINITY_DN774244_c0_g1_i1.p1  ORF type:complete len:179 (+),score=49.16 TRINITY_DN774244_c0_g1_i1:154-690(+)
MNDEQKEELEVLRSILDPDSLELIDDDPSVSPKLKVEVQGELSDGSTADVMVQFVLVPEYPEACAPGITVLNKFMADEVKMKIVQELEELAEGYVGMASIYDLVEHLKSSMDMFGVQSSKGAVEEVVDEPKVKQVKAEKKKAAEKLSKGQKRRKLDKGEHRGHDWIDVVGHLRKTGSE